MPTGAIVALAIIGALLAVAAFFALRYARSERRKADRSAGTETSTCGDVANLAGSVAGEVGGQLFRQRCELVGRARAEQAELAAPFSKQPCVWHRSLRRDLTSAVPGGRRHGSDRRGGGRRDRRGDADRRARGAPPLVGRCRCVARSWR